MYVRVRDPQTRHEFDLPEHHPWLTKGQVERVKPKQYPASRLARPSKHYVNLAGRPATQEPPPPPGEGEANNANTPEEE